MKQPSSTTRLSWRPVLMLAGFAAVAFCMVSVDWSEAQGQEVKKAKAKAKDFAKKDLPKKALEKKGFAKKAFDFPQKLEPVPPRVFRQTPGAGQKLDHAALAKLIDEEVNRRLKSDDVKASGRSDDAEFLRRVSLDLIGVVPTAEQVVEFLDNKDPDKRAKAIDRLLADPRFGQFYGELWTGLMVPRDTNNRILDSKPLTKWLAEEFNKNTPLNKIVFDVLTSSGKQDEQAAVTYFVANASVDKITDNVSRMFLGVQLQCAQCHNHPFTDWKQKEYWGMAQFFMKTRVTVNPQMAKKNGDSPAIAETNAPLPKKKGLPESAMVVRAKFLGAEEPRMSAAEPARPILAQWLCSAENPYFAKAMVNRFWHHLFGRGLVNPVDDMHENNAPSHPELLTALTEQFKNNTFDVKHLIRAICTSEAYQRTSRPAHGNGDDRELYSHRAVRALLPEQLYESLIQATGRELVAKKGDFAAPFAKKGPLGGPREQFINFFRVTDEPPDVLDYQSGIPQVLRLMNAPITNAVGGRVNQAIRAVGATETDKVIEQLYLNGLSRRPTPDESERLVAFVRQHPVNPVTAYTDIFWSLLNSSEFVLNH
jgi:hypothetical protein